ncbi:NrfD/PsrC family molybdoenzyme membrane anchor subunit [Streptomyces sp. NPDC051940]|uniref:NrfD/PsrC family molybdoenzyme membrane anchor subunit n=1 Tax=Streptomyces sp. NPDC051940 TaxID=3155675 RepID=UPI003442101E
MSAYLLAEDAQHFVRSPEWTWYIWVYFFFAGLSGGSYALASLHRLRGGPGTAGVARLGYYTAFATLLVCPVMLILDLGRPLRFWHMMWNTTPDGAGLNFKYWSPMSVGVWALLVYGAFATLSFGEALARDGRLRLPLSGQVLRLLDGVAGRIVAVVGLVFGLFIAGYTGVLLSVSNQPVWSDTWALGGLFLASGLAGSAALLHFLTRYRADAGPGAPALVVTERLYALLELALVVVFALTLLPAGTADEVFGYPWLLLWLVALAGMLPGLSGLAGTRLAVTGEGVTVPVQPAAAARTAAVTAAVLLGVLALRAAVIFTVQ